MVLDWRADAEACLRDGRLIPIFHASPLEKRLQQTYVAKLIVERGGGYGDVKAFFDRAGCQVPDLPEMASNALAVQWPKERDLTVWVTDAELAAISSSPFPLEFRRFAVAMLCVAKVMRLKKGCPTVNVRDRSYAYHLAFGGDDYSVGRRRGRAVSAWIAKAMSMGLISITPQLSRIRRGKGYVKVYNAVLSADWIEWDASDGFRVSDMESDVAALCSSVRSGSAECPVCGARFEPSPKAKTTLCPACWERGRLAAKRECERKRRGRKAKK